MSNPEAWLLGKVKGFSDALMPVVHALVQARREIAALRGEISTRQCRSGPGGAAAIGFHIAHITGSLDRLFTYVRGESLSPDQVNYFHKEKCMGLEHSRDELFSAVLGRIDICLEALREISDRQLLESRAVGREQLPSNVIGLLFHSAEHTTMHVGQIRTTLKVIRGLASADHNLGCDRGT